MPMPIMLPFPPSSTSLPCPAQIGLTVAIAIARRAGRIRVRIAGLVRLMVDAADFAALLAHALVVDDVFGPADASALRGFCCAQAEGAAGGAGAGVGLEDCLAAVGGCGCCCSGAPQVGLLVGWHYCGRASDVVWRCVRLYQCIRSSMCGGGCCLSL
jgi:hypothetical protein